MTALEALQIARENGLCVEVDGTDLVLDADREPPIEVLDAIQRHKTEIIALLKDPENDRSAEEWREFFDERAAIAEFDGGQSRVDAETSALQCCIAFQPSGHGGLRRIEPIEFDRKGEA